MAKKVFSPEEASKRYAALPAEVKALIYGPEMLMIVRQIAQKHQLHIDQTGILEDETNAVMLGFTDTAEFPDVLTTSLNIDAQKARAMAEDISNLLFAKIRESMKKAPQPAPAAVAPPPIKLPPAEAPHSPTPVPVVKIPVPITPSAPVQPSPVAKPLAPATPATPSTPLIPKPSAPLAADLALSQKTITAPKTPSVTPSAAPAPAAAKPPANKPPAPPKPGGYTADPYREPTE